MHLRAVAALLVTLACVSGTTGPQGYTTPRHLLFIGNSLTYSNDLPGMVQALARVGEDDPLEVASVTFGGVSLEDHWNDGRALQRIADHPWDLVILQQGPSGAPESRVLLIEYAKKFAVPIRAAGARPAVYMVWPEITRPTASDSVASNYTAAAESIDAMLFPGIRTWQAIWSRDSSMELYSSDGLHPTALGTYAIAVLMVHQITGRPATSLPSTFTLESGATYRFAPGIAHLVQEAAEEAARSYGR